MFFKSQKVPQAPRVFKRVNRNFVAYAQVRLLINLQIAIT